MATRRSSPTSLRAGTLVAIVIIIAILYVAKAVLIPMALAILLTFLLAPAVIRLQSLGLGRVLSVVIVTALSFAFIGALGWVVAGQVVELADQLPQYKDNISNKARSLRGSASGWLGRATESLKEISEEVSTPSPAAGDSAATQAALPTSEEIVSAQAPIPVEIAEKPPNPFESVAAALTPFFAPLASAGIVIVFVFFMLIQREDLRDRIIHLIGEGQVTLTTKAIDDAAQRVSRYLVALLIVNATYGLAVGIGLFLIGLPNALLWGVLAALFRFIPYVGPWIGAALPIVLSLAVFDNWTQPLITVSLFVIIELLSNNVMEPLLYGSRTGITPVAVLLSAVFWGWLWGPVGLVLATPLTVCLVVIGRYVPRLEFLSVLLGDQPSLTPEVRVYQRLLAMDQDGVFEIAQQFIKEHSLIEFYEQVLLPAMSLAERDQHHGDLEPDRRQYIYQSLHDLVENLGERAKKDKMHEDEHAVDELEFRGRAARVLCLPAHDEADEIAAIMLAQILEAEGFEAMVIPTHALASEKLNVVDDRRPDVVCVSALPPLAVMHARYLCKRLTTRFDELRIVVGLWNVTDLNKAQDRIKTCGTALVVSNFSQALNELQSLPYQTPSEQPTPRITF